MKDGRGSRTGPGGAAWDVRSGELWVDGRSCRSLAEEFGTPLYVVSERRLRSNAQWLSTAFQKAWPYGPARLLPSLKANPTLATRRILNEEGLGCDTFGETELALALAAGVDPALISVNGASKTPSLIRRALAVGARITLDSARELPLVEAIARATGTVAKVRLRVRPHFDDLVELTDFLTDGTTIRTAAQRYKAGIPYDDLVELGRKAIASDAVDLVGLHVHLGRHSADPDVWQKMVRDFVDVVAQLSSAWSGWMPLELDLGGGWPSSGDPTGRRHEAGRLRPPAMPADQYAGRVATALAEAFRERGLSPEGLILEAEPGRAIYADAGLHLARVTNVKQQTNPEPRTWVETDTSELFLGDTVVEQSFFIPVLVERVDEAPVVRTDVTGMSCNFDLLAPDVLLPAVREGELIAFLETGAYNEASASNFNGLPRPATVLVNGDQAEIIKRRESIEDVLARDSVPTWLGVAGLRHWL